MSHFRPRLLLPAFLAIAALACAGNKKSEPAATPGDAGAVAADAEAANDSGAPDAGAEMPDAGEAVPDAGEEPATITVAAPEGSVPVWRLFETSAALDETLDNPFDPAQIKVTGEFVDPAGQQQTMPGFYAQDYTRELVNGTEQLTPAGEPLWKVRFTPAREGRWRWRWQVTRPEKTEFSAWREFSATAPGPDRHGFVRRSTADFRYLAFDDGAPFFAIGENIGWYDGRGTFAYDDWLAKLRAAGGNFARLWMASWSVGLEWTARDERGALTGSSLGNYTARLDRAWQLDQILRLAEQNGIYLMLCLLNHGAFSTSTNPEWENNPYSSANGGPLDAAGRFFTDDAAKDLFRRRLRYIVARWGYSPNIMAWELWNEVDFTDQTRADILANWHEEMAAAIEDLDPFAHLITTSTAKLAPLLGIDKALYALDEIDFAQFHLYGMEGYDIDFTKEVPSLSRAALDRYQKPVLAGEVGVDYRGPNETMARDPEFAGLHDIIWSGVFSGTFGTGMNWWWDSIINPYDLYVHFAAVHDLVTGVNFAAENFAGEEVALSAGEKTLTAHLLRGENTILVWIKNDGHQWFAGLDQSVIAGAALELGGVADGQWQVTWIDPYRGDDPAGAEISVSGGAASVPIPPFSRDLAARIEREASGN